MACDEGMFYDFRQRSQCPDFQLLFVEANEPQVLCRPKTDEHFGREQTLLHVRIKIGTARNDQCIRSMGRKERGGFSSAAGRLITKGRQAEHYACTGAFGFCGGSVLMRSGAPPAASIAFKIFSGVIGVEWTRALIASATAFAMAGMTGLSGP